MTITAINTIILFFLINSFYIIYPINSSFLSFVFAFIVFLFRRKRTTIDLTRTYKIKELYFPFILIIIIGSGSILITLLHTTLDFSYTKNNVSQFIQYFLILFVSICIIPTPSSNVNSIDYICKLIVLSFCLQSLVQLVAFLSPSFASYIHYTYTDTSLINLYEGYEGIRGLALTGSPGWGLSIGYGLAFIFYIKTYLLNTPINFKSVIILTLLIIGAFFAGRSSFLGLILGVIYLIFYNSSPLKTVKKIAFFTISFSLLIISIYYIFPSFSQLIIEKVFPFVFEFYYVYEYTGEFQTGSTNKLMEMWQVPIGDWTWLTGDGLFINPSDKKYYMHTDVGYIRNLLFGGLFWVLLISAYHFILCSGLKLNNKILQNTEKGLILFLILYSALLELKAMSLGFNKYLFTIISILYITIIIEIKKRRVICQSKSL